MPQLSKKKRRFLALDVLLIVLMIALDRATKVMAVARLKEKAAFVLIRDVLELSYLENHGAAFGILQNQKVFLVLIAVMIVCIIGYVLLVLPDDGKYNVIHILLSMLAAGALGNMIDRLMMNYVVDFISFVIIHFPVFNVADIYVTMSTAILVLLFLFYYKEQDLNFLSFRQQNRYREIK